MEEQNKPVEKKDRWISKFSLFALVLVIIACVLGNSMPSLPNILGIVYIISGIVWFGMHSKSKEA